MLIRNGEIRTHNIRVFVKVGTDWKLLGWANEAA
jgi:hypothetical protein